MSFSWTDERVEQLKEFWREGRSCSQIAKALGGLTRSAVIGKVHRLKLAGRARPINPGARKAAAPKLTVVRPPKAPPTPKPERGKHIRPTGASRPLPFDKSASHGERVAAIAAVPVSPKPWLERAFGECAAPIDAGGETYSCCNPVPPVPHGAPPASYCLQHQALFFAPAPAKPITWRDDATGKYERQRRFG